MGPTILLLLLNIAVFAWIVRKAITSCDPEGVKLIT